MRKHDLEIIKINNGSYIKSNYNSMSLKINGDKGIKYSNDSYQSGWLYYENIQNIESVESLTAGKITETFFALKENLKHSETMSVRLEFKDVWDEDEYEWIEEFKHLEAWYEKKIVREKDCWTKDTFYINKQSVLNVSFNDTPNKFLRGIKVSNLEALKIINPGMAPIVNSYAL
ncbi:MAG: hypothetical protein QM489_01150 [Candidatus Izemoplasma sp.]